MHGKDSLLSRAQLRWSWVGFLALAVHAPIVSWATPDDSWLLSVTVAALVGMVIAIDDHRRHRPAKAPAAEPVSETE